MVSQFGHQRCLPYHQLPFAPSPEVTVESWLAASGDIASAATALGGLILVFIGFAVAEYGSYDATQQRAVRLTFQRRGALGFAAFVLALLAAGFALYAKAKSVESLAGSSFFLLIGSFLCVLVMAAWTLMDLWPD